MIEDSTVQDEQKREMSSETRPVGRGQHPTGHWNVDSRAETNPKKLCMQTPVINQSLISR
jgi:hypothetical protein